MYRGAELRRRAASFLAPNRCPFCDGITSSEEYWHESCFKGLVMLDGFPEPPEGLSELFACCEYGGAARSAVIRLKNGFYIYSAEAMGVLLTEAVGTEIRRFDLITFVPSGFASVLRRGYTPAAAVAGQLSLRSGKKLVRTLRVTGGRSEQKLLNAAQRRENAAKGLCVVNKRLICGKNILIVDDICTTGGTLSACAGLLREAGAADVAGAVFAKTTLATGS